MNKEKVLELLARAKETDDDDLLNMALSMLDEPKQEEDGIHYICDNCEHELYSEKTRIRCPKCKKHKLVAQSNIVRKETKPQKQEKPRRETDYSQFTTSTKNNTSEKDRIRYNEDGEPEGTYTKSEPLQIKENQFEDDTLLFKADTLEQQKLHQKLGGLAMVPRSRPKPKYDNVTCNKCGRDHKVLAIHARGKDFYMCDRCIAKNARR